MPTAQDQVLDLTPVEIAAAQRKGKMTAGLFGALMDPTHSEWVTGLVGYVWVVKRRDDPTTTYESVQKLTLAQLIEEAGFDLDDDGLSDTEGDEAGR